MVADYAHHINSILIQAVHECINDSLNTQVENHILLFEIYRANHRKRVIGFVGKSLEKARPF